ncbi:leukocyte receptor cluster member 9-like isoform X3 [Watersipora subatra]|uniref:leukocyte receptor cluster member 9-like isoform X3 n=1 Tax=Watersipora subatra TaxID=2589382 RepID=UPI00355BF430
MAGMAVAQTKAAEEIEQLKSITRCKIMKDVGDFAFLIDARVPDSEVLIKFQITSKYPDVPPGIFVKNAAITKDEVQKMLSSVSQNATTLTDIFQSIQDYLSDCPTMAAASREESSPQTSRKDKTSVQKSESPDKNSKKPPMRTAADVIKRIQWDSSLKSEAFVVGYVDRFLGIQEQPFNAFNWVNPAEADWMDLNIPEHRIEYFKYNDVIVWEKKSRCDNVFGSTGGKTIDQMLSETEGFTEPAQPDEDVIEQPPADTSTIKQDNVVKKQSGNRKGGAVKARQEKAKEQIDRPNHFVAIPVNDSLIQKAIWEIQEEYLTLSQSDGEECKKELYNLHITLCAVRINDQNELDAVTETLYELITDSHLPQELVFDKLDCFWGRILYARAKLNEEFEKFALQFRKSLVEKNIRIFDDVNEFKPHMTIISFPRYKASSIFYPLEEFVRVKSNQGVERLTDLPIALQEVIIYSMERDDDNRYIQKMTLDMHC